MVGSRIKDIQAFYSLLDTLERITDSACKLGNCSGRMNWPKRGVYFFKENGEIRTDSGTGMRIVRVGTHALKLDSKTKLWTRLSQHRGTQRTGGGNHRGSIFRLIVGTSLIGRFGYTFPSWGEGKSAPKDVRNGEKPLEMKVSSEIGSMPFLWLAVEDGAGPESKRGYIERNAIALLSNSNKPPIDSPSSSWLGHHCDRPLVRQSGLWNNNHVNENYNPEFLAELEQLIAKMGSAS